MINVHVYAVCPGDSLYSIADKFGVLPAVIVNANGLKDAVLKIGEAIIIPVCVVYHRVLKGQTLRSVAESFQIKPGDIIYQNPEAAEKLQSGEILKIRFPIMNK